MSATDRTIQTPRDLLRYRSWRGEFSGSTTGIIAIARVSLRLMFRRKLFWVFYGLSVMIFLFFFYGQYLQVFLEQRVTEENLRVGGLFPKNVKPELLLRQLRNILQLNGSTDTYANFIWFEGYIVMVMLALIGSAIIGNDFQFGSLPFYLSKPISRWHYIAGKCLAVAIFINLMTTIPALLLFLEYGFIEDWSYYWLNIRILFGIFSYGFVLTLTLSLLLMATATWVRRTVPMVMIWSTLFVFGRLMQRWIVDGMHLSVSWRLIDLWNNIYLVGQWALGTPHEELRPTSQTQPEYWEPAVVLLLISAVCVYYLNRRIRAVEVIA